MDVQSLRAGLSLALRALWPIVGVALLVGGGDQETAILLLVSGVLQLGVYPALSAWSPSKDPDDYR